MMGGPGMLMLIASAGAAALLLWAAVSDWNGRIIPNRISLLLAGLAFPWLALDAIPVGPLSALVALGLVLAGGLVLFARGWLGGGDIKLMAAFAPWCGLEGLPAFLLATSLAGGLLAVGWSAAGFTRARPAGGAGTDGLRGVGTAVELPYGLAIAAGGLAMLGLRLVQV